MSTPNSNIVFENVSKFYGEVLGVNRSISRCPRRYQLGRPERLREDNADELVTGLVRPTQGRVSVLGLTPTNQKSSSVM